MELTGAGKREKLLRCGGGEEFVARRREAGGGTATRFPSRWSSTAAGDSGRRRSALRSGNEATEVDECGRGKEITPAPLFIKKGEAAVTD